MSDAIRLRVKAKTDGTAYRTITISDRGHMVACDCGGFDGVICSHVDAVLIAEEQAMVHEDDIAAAAVAVDLVRGKLAVPEYWRGTWRRELKWRGLSRQGQARRIIGRTSGRPLVCFTGKLDRPRSEMIVEAKANGWDVVNSPSRFTDVLVAGDLSAPSAKLKAARANGTTVVTLEEWGLLMLDGVLPS